MWPIFFKNINCLCDWNMLALLRTFNYHLLRRLSKAQGGSGKFDIAQFVVSRWRFNWFLRCFFKRNQGCFEFLIFLKQSLIFFKKSFFSGQI